MNKNSLLTAVAALTLVGPLVAVSASAQSQGREGRSQSQNQQD